MSSINRKLANLITTTGDVATSALDNAASMQVFSSVDSLPVSGLSAGDQALVGQRLYISNGSGWYNVALINATPSLTLSSSGTIALSNDGTPTVITMTATDSDNSNANLFLTLESGGDLFKFATISQDSSVVTITPRTQDSATTLGFDGGSTLTFKASDGINQATVQNTFTLAFSIANSKSTSVLLQVDASATDNQVDASTNTHTITEAGNIASSAFSPYHPGGYSVTFDGTGDYIRFDNAVLAEGTGDFTAEAWVYRTGSHSTNDTIFGHDAAPGYQIAFGSSNNLRFDVGTSSGDEYLSTGTLEANRWYHIVYQRASGVLQGFKDGVSLGTQSVTTNFTNTKIDVGVNRGGTAYFEGYLRDVRIVKGTAVYSGSGFTPPTAPLTAISGTSLLTCHLPYIVDGSSNNISPTINGNTSTARFSPYDYEAAYTKADHGGAVYFDGNGSDNITASNIAIAGNCTFEFWFYQDIAQSNAYRCMLGANTYGSGVPFTLYTYGSNVTLWLSNSGGPHISGAFTAFAWHHMAMVRNSGTWTLYINGVAKGTSTTGGSYDFAATTDYRFGENHAGSYDWRGYISDARFVSGTAVYTTAFTPPTAPLTAITNTQLLTCTNKNDIWDAGGTATGLAGNLFTRSGSVASSNTQRKFTTSSSIYYTGSYPRTVHYLGPETYFRTGDFTIEGWVWFNAVNVADGVFHLRAGALANDTNGLAVGIQNNGNLRCYFNNTQLTSTTAATAQTWIHFAAVRNNGSATFYVNGTATSIANVSDTNDYQLTHLHTGVYYGTWPANYDLTGYIQGFRVTKGLARYTSNFTPSTTEFTG